MHKNQARLGNGFARSFGAVAIIAGVCGLAGTAFATPADTKLIYRDPAGEWLEALPIGNGRMGGMVFGGVELDRVQFNEQTLWLGTEKTREMGSYQPFGDLWLEFSGDRSPITSYRRELDLDEAVVRVSYERGGVRQRREYFASRPDGAIVVRLSADRPAQVSVSVRLKDVRPNQAKIGAGEVSFEGSLDKGLELRDVSGRPPPGSTSAGGGDTPNNLKYAAAARVIAEGGRVLSTRDSVKVEGADAVTIVLCAATDFVNSPLSHWRGEPPRPKVESRLNAVAPRPYQELMAAHILDHQSLFRRVKLDLGAAVAAGDTRDRLRAFAAGRADPALEALLFNFGRYLLIASSRPGGLPANLQGLWNADLRPAWYSGYTTNINVEMNYWAAEVVALPECHEPLFDWIENLAAVQKRSSDPRLQTAVGWIIYSTNNPFGGNSGWAIHQPGSAWLTRHFWEHFAFGRDRQFLSQRAYPLLRELVLYWEARLVVGPDGTLITPDGWSPEHGPVSVGGKTVLKEGDRTPRPGASYDQQIIWDLFSNFIEASKVLGVDVELRERVADVRSRLRGPTIGRWGQLQEWLEDVDDPADQHRHLAHLFAVYPGRQISPALDPVVAQAAKVSLDARGDGATGWSRAWKINLWARFGEGDRAEKVIRALLHPVVPGSEQSGTLPNLFGSCPPFQIDSNFGATAGIAEMLLQSHLSDDAGVPIVDLLPALPTAWAKGSVQGLRARGGITVDLQWNSGRLTSAQLCSASASKVIVRYRKEVRPIDLKAGEVFQLTLK